MAKDQSGAVNPSVGKDKRADTLSISSPDPNFIDQILGEDFNRDEEITFTVTGKVTEYTSRDSSDFPESRLSLDISSINGKTKKKQTNDKEMQDMEEDAADQGVDEDEEET